MNLLITNKQVRGKTYSVIQYLKMGNKQDKPGPWQWHFTNEAGAKAIKESGKINQSLKSNGDAIFGDGTYSTELGPFGKMTKCRLKVCLCVKAGLLLGNTEKIAKNNWDGGSRKAAKDGKLDYAVGYRLTEKGSKNMSYERDGERKVNVYKGKEGVNLKDSENVSYFTVVNRRKAEDNFSYRMHTKNAIDKSVKPATWLVNDVHPYSVLEFLLLEVLISYIVRS